MINVTLRRRAKQFSRLVRSSAVQRRLGEVHRPVLSKNGDLGLTFIGHSGFFLQTGGKNLVIDPNFARWLFVLKRLRNAGMRIKDLPPIDCVLITHAHFDHLHRPSLRRIARLTRQTRGVAPTIIVPHGCKDLVRHLGFSDVVEMKWWDQVKLGWDFSVTHVPAKHWGARLVHDTHRGFGGYVVRSSAHSIYHAGDTAYFQGFSEIGRRLKPDIALLPIGAYYPDAFRNVHTSPEDAIRAFQDLGSRVMVPMHYGTFRLSHEPMDEPLQRLEWAAANSGLSEHVVVLEEGVTQFF